MSWSLPTSVPGSVRVMAVLTPERNRFFHQNVVNLVMMCSTRAVPCPPAGWLMVAKGVCQHTVVVGCEVYEFEPSAIRL